MGFEGKKRMRRDLQKFAARKVRLSPLGCSSAKVGKDSLARWRLHLVSELSTRLLRLACEISHLGNLYQMALKADFAIPHYTRSWRTPLDASSAPPHDAFPFGPFFPAFNKCRLESLLFDMCLLLSSYFPPQNIAFPIFLQLSSQSTMPSQAAENICFLRSLMFKI